MLGFYCLTLSGVPISVLLSVWSFLAFLTGFKVALGLGIWQAFWCSALGWAVFQVMQRTIGRPVASNWSWLKEYQSQSQFSNGSSKELRQILKLEYSVRLATIAAIKKKIRR